MRRTSGTNDGLVNWCGPTWATVVSLIGWWDLRAFAGSEGTKLNYHGPFAFCELLTVQDTKQHAERPDLAAWLQVNRQSTCTGKYHRGTDFEYDTTVAWFIWGFQFSEILFAIFTVFI